MHPEVDYSSLQFTQRLLDWFDDHGRKSLPWQRNKDPYGIWISEIMLQQTRVETVIPYYQNFIDRFPDITELAEAKPDEVMALWSGLGYYARARNLHRAAQQILDRHQGIFPSTLGEVMALPGVGRSTAGAILAFSGNARHPILDGNVKRVLTRFLAIPGYPGNKSVENKLWEIADHFTPKHRAADYTQAIMDLGATLCTRSQPECTKCPVRDTCVALQQGKTDRFPQRKPAAVRPRRRSRMMLIQNPKAEYLLIKRPPSGIWGGMWVFPEITDINIEHRAWCKTELGLTVSTGKPGTPVRHGFTHFELEIQPLNCLIEHYGNQVMDSDQYLWYNPLTGAPIGIPTAVRTIFKQLGNGATTKGNEDDTNDQLHKTG